MKRKRTGRMEGEKAGRGRGRTGREEGRKERQEGGRKVGKKRMVRTIKGWRSEDENLCSEKKIGEKRTLRLCKWREGVKMRKEKPTK